MLARPSQVLAEVWWGRVMEQAHISVLEREMLVSILTESRDATVAAAESLSGAQWTFRPCEKCWTIGENVEHLITVERNIFGLVKKTLSRSPSVTWHASTAGKEELLRNMLLDRTQKREAPEAVQPTGRLDRAEALRVYQECRNELLDFAATTTEPIKAHTEDHRRPAVGTLNAYQWILFIALHNQRHLDQITEVLRTPAFEAV
jgi:uncharacterized damage-inducible protein DinB